MGNSRVDYDLPLLCMEVHGLKTQGRRELQYISLLIPANLGYYY